MTEGMSWPMGGSRVGACRASQWRHAHAVIPMRALFSLVALVAALAVVLVLVKQQMAAVKVPTLAAPSAHSASAPAGQNVRQQLDQLKQELDEAARQSARQLENP